MNEADVVLERVAVALEGPDFGDIMGIAAKRKRDREDAALRGRVRREQRAEIARWIRSYQSDGGNNRLARFLEEVRDGSEDQYSWGPSVAAAVLAGLVTVTIALDLSTHLANCHPRFTFTLTDKGTKWLARFNEPERNPVEAA